MNKLLLIILLPAFILLSGGCKKFLDVQPEASYTEVQVYENEAAIQQAFNGIYLDMASSKLYGAYLSNTVVEMMAQRYKAVTAVENNISYSVFNNYDYTSTSSQLVFDSLWRKAYSTLLATNVFLSKIDNAVGAGVIASPNANLLKGEALAVRAMVHFDLLRLFGPTWEQAGSEKAIPYYTLADGKMQPIITAAEAIEKILADLTQAEVLLENDAIRTAGVVFNNNFYTGARNQRLNYYAVKTLKARVLLWMNNKAKAHAEALDVLNEGEKWFAWVDAADVTNSTYPDRAFAPEILFGLYVPQLYNNYDLFFNPILQDNSLLVPDNYRLNETYEGLQQDYRYIQTWLLGNGRNNRTFYKYAPFSVVAPNAVKRRFIQPLLRKSELYYILAETETDATVALNYLNSARRRRGLANLPATAILSSEIRKEYQKEFWGEGQLFFFYKRKNDSSVPSADMPYSWAIKTVDYIVPLPLSETITR